MTSNSFLPVYPSYPMKVWMSALFIVSPLCFWIEDIILTRNIRIHLQDLMTLLLFGLMGSVLSLPIFGVLFLAFRFLTKKQFASSIVRWILNGLCILGIFITLIIIDKNPQFGIAISYSVSVIIASLFFKIYHTPFNKTNRQVLFPSDFSAQD